MSTRLHKLIIGACWVADCMKKCRKVLKPSNYDFVGDNFVWRSSHTGNLLCFALANLKWINFFGEKWSDAGLELGSKGRIIGE